MDGHDTVQFTPPASSPHPSSLLPPLTHPPTHPPTHPHPPLPFMPRYSPDLWDLIRLLLARNPAERPTMDELWQMEMVREKTPRFV